MEESNEIENENVHRARTGIGWLFWLAVGVAVGALIAPDSGKANRNRLMQKVDSWRSDVDRLGHDATGKTEYEMGKATGFAHNLGRRMGIVKSSRDDIDDVVNQRVKTELGENPRTLGVARLNIDTVEGVVTIRGHVDTEHQRRAIEDVAETVQGVRKLINMVNIGDVAAAG